MVVVLEKDGLDGKARPYTLDRAEAGMHAAGGQANSLRVRHFPGEWDIERPAAKAER